MVTDEHNPSAAAGHELTDAPLRPIVLVGGAVAVVALVVFVFSVGVFRFFSERPVNAPLNPMAAEAPAFPSAPRIEIAPAIEYQQLRTEEDRVLFSYGWVDRNAGTVHIPINRAIDLQLQRGFPVRKEATKK